jgi:steroid 5-alpha reductase family enzyme
LDIELNYFRPLYPFLFGWAVILASSSFAVIGVVNGIAQLLLFALVVCLPIWRTGRMSYVDIGWPWGLVVLAVLAYGLSDGYWPRALAISLLLALVGLRMGIGAVNLWRLGLLKKEFARYQYQRVRWQAEGKNNVGLALQVDAISQGLANASFLALPVFMLAANARPQISLLEVIGFAISVLALVLESLADFQKVKFLRAMKRQGLHNQVCDVGLWKYCRHPNYFHEWMVWNGMVIAAIPSWLALQEAENPLLWIMLGVGLLFASKAMYTTLVHTTGAVPSEYYSEQKRPDYRSYQARTNRFFPGWRRSG